MEVQHPILELGLDFSSSITSGGEKVRTKLPDERSIRRCFSHLFRRAAALQNACGNETGQFDRLLSIVYVIVTHKRGPMKFITVRELRGRSGQVWNKLARERDMILTSNGKPIAILSAVSEETLEESLAAVRRARAVAAVEHLQRQSVRTGTDKLSSAEIAAEVRASRKARRR